MTLRPGHRTQSATHIGLRVLLALLLMPHPMAHAEEKLGRLFFTPEIRQRLDQQRQLEINGKRRIADNPSLTINGLVSRSSGKSTVWVNGIAQSGKPSADELRITANRKKPGRVSIHSNVSLLAQAGVGDTLDPTTGKSTDILGDGRITVKAPRKPPSRPPREQ